VRLNWFDYCGENFLKQVIVLFLAIGILLRFKEETFTFLSNNQRLFIHESASRKLGIK